MRLLSSQRIAAPERRHFYGDTHPWIEELRDADERHRRKFRRGRFRVLPTYERLAREGEDSRCIRRIDHHAADAHDLCRAAFHLPEGGDDAVPGALRLLRRVARDGK